MRSGAPWQRIPHDSPPWEAGYQQTQRRLKADVFELIVPDLRVVLLLAEGHEADFVSRFSVLWLPNTQI
jgi:hypothetical protein